MNQYTFGHDALGRYLEGRLRQVREWALDKLTEPDADLDALIERAREDHRVTPPAIMREAIWVEFKPAGNGRAVTNSEPDRILIHVPLSGTAELINHVGREGRHGQPCVHGDELVLVEERQLTYFPERTLDAASARKVGEEISARALRTAEACVAEVASRSAEIERFDAALKAVLDEQRGKVENARRYRSELQAGIGLPTARPPAEGREQA